MKDYNTIRLERFGDVARLTLNRPALRNALSSEMLDEASDALRTTVDLGARALLFAAEGVGFCSGLDLGEARERRRAGASSQLVDTHFNPFAIALSEFPLPIVTAVNGSAVGAGMAVALAGDIVVAARSAVFSCAFVTIGAVPDTGATWLIAQSVGRARALEMMLTGEKVTADRARADGLIARVVEDIDLSDEALLIAEKLASGPTYCMGLIRRQVRDALGTSFTLALDVESRNQDLAKRSPDFDESIAAFLEKRPPNYGRKVLPEKGV